LPLSSLELCFAPMCAGVHLSALFAQPLNYFAVLYPVHVFLHFRRVILLFYVH
jgi:hypothetical protein